jgi:hypothetical protein
MNPKQNPPTQPTQTGRFAATTKMGDVLNQNPNTRWVLQQFHIGGCSHCGFDMNDTVQKVAEDNGVPLEHLLTAINNA